MLSHHLDIDSLPINVTIYKKEGNDFIITDINKSAEAAEEVHRNEIIGHKLTEIFPQVKESALFDVLLHVEASGEQEIIHTNGYEDDRIKAWRHNTVVKLNDGTVAVFYEDHSLEKELSKEDSLLNQQDQIFQYIMKDSESIAVQGYNKNHQINYWNKASELLYGYCAKEAIGQELEALIIPETMKQEVSLLIDQWIDHGIPIPTSEITLVNKKGNDVHVFSQHVMIKVSKNDYEMYRIDIDLSKIDTLQKELLIQKNFLKTMINVIPDLIWIKDTEGKYLACNTEFERFYGIKESELIGKDDFDLVDFESANFFQNNHRKILKSDESHIDEEILTFSDGSYKGLFETIRIPMKDAEDNIIGVLAIARDISKRKAKENELSICANYDMLTGLANRTLFMDRLMHLMRRRSSTDSYSAVLFIDLDHFKEINDTFGHATGDKILKLISRSLQSIIRKEDTLSRHGGDEFTILLENIRTPLDAGKVAQKILDILKTPLSIGNHQFHVTASIGITIAFQDSSDPETLLRFADIAMYKIKNSGRNGYAFYTSDLSKQAHERIMMEKALSTAVTNHEFQLYYQPQINVLNKKVIGAEALLRWEHPTKGIIKPVQFISVAESSGQIIEIGKWVIRQVMKDMKKWKEEHLDIESVSINLSVKQLNDKTLIDTIKDSFKATGCHPGWIEFEIIEGYAISDQRSTTSLIREIHALGCKISIDDFGTGCSSLAYLQRLPIHKIKIDQSFVQDVPGNSDGEAIVSAVILLAKSMNLDVIAEGVESSPQQAFLLEHGCIFSQGFLYTEPLAKEEFEAYLKLSLIQEGP